MAKSTSGKARGESIVVASLSGPGSAAQQNFLRRNQACHQCRRRKLKCDARRPACTTCLRSHRHAQTLALQTKAHVPDVDCTYDESATRPESPTEALCVELEDRILELEARLKQQQLQNDSTVSSISSINTSTASLALPNEGPSSVTLDDLNILTSYSTTNDPTQHISHLLHRQLTVNDNGPSQQSLPIAPSISTIYSPPLPPPPPLPPSTEWYAIDPRWPRSLPSPGLLRHLVDSFFTFHPHAGRLFHTPTFMASISFPPTHPKFPSLSILHALCAVGSLYTSAAMPHVPTYPSNQYYGRDTFEQRQAAATFGEIHISLAKRAVHRDEVTGTRLLEYVQAKILVTWWLWYHARWRELYDSNATTMRGLVPLGLNVCDDFHPLNQVMRGPSLIGSAKSAMEKELRRNCFWLAYSSDRQQGCSNEWALNMDDQDLPQLMPARGDQFDLEYIHSEDDRQMLQSHNLFIFHPEKHTDSFTLYIKGSVLLSRVKQFNMRFTVKRCLGDPSVEFVPPDTGGFQSFGLGAITESVFNDPRRSVEFIELDSLAESFRPNFPHYLKNPMPDGVVDSHLYVACLVSHMAIILLHESHARFDLGIGGCSSTYKIHQASRAILELIYSLRAGTSFDITLLEPSAVFYWYSAGRVLLKFWAVAKQAMATEEALTLRAEVEYIAVSLSVFGERIPLAREYRTALGDFAVSMCGEQLSV